jgi:hypothetical protein
MVLTSKLKKVLGSARSERPIARWLKCNPLVLCHAVCSFPFAQYLVAEFPLGSDYKADFVLLGPYSGGWEIHFVELEPPNERLFTRGGVQAKRLREAVKQVDDWRSFIDKNRACVIRDLAKFAQKKNLLREETEDEPSDNCGRPISHPKSIFDWYFSVIIGRRKSMHEDDILRKAAFRSQHSIEVMTHDRLLDMTTKLDALNRRRS